MATGRRLVGARELARAERPPVLVRAAGNDHGPLHTVSRVARTQTRCGMRVLATWTKVHSPHPFDARCARCTGVAGKAISIAHLRKRAA